MADSLLQLTSVELHRGLTRIKAITALSGSDFDGIQHQDKETYAEWVFVASVN
ncbi:hypothetical protein [Polaromonas sp. LjRoot131]|uniref:hypothetical protein n=1 Tax=Polaromonas sp. LjRoot131 TaxID=3342262 RepID=UPI003ECEBB16